MTPKPDIAAQIRAAESKAAEAVTIGKLGGDRTALALDAMIDVMRVAAAVATAERPALTAGQVRTIANAVAGAVALRLVVAGILVALVFAGVAGVGAYTYAGGFSQVCGQTQAGVRVCQWTPR